MKKYKVTAENVGGYGGKLFEKGSIVTDENFPKGHPEKLVKAKCLELILEKKKK
jgi:hypothetical protein|tara:strand:+ start:2114 stop:2275 length:162 start_codon:yes stop_codon:yes gene_type:complete